MRQKGIDEVKDKGGIEKDGRKQVGGADAWHFVGIGIDALQPVSHPIGEKQKGSLHGNQKQALTPFFKESFGRLSQRFPCYFIRADKSVCDQLCGLVHKSWCLSQKTALRKKIITDGVIRRV
jgi:hypothetical protein